MKGILTNCITKDESVVDIEYEITEEGGRKAFSLLNGPTGWESFYISSKYANLKAMSEKGWLANIGTHGKYDRLFITGEEMKKVFEKEGILEK